MKEIVITDKEENQRLDKFLLKYLNKAPKSFVYKMLRKKRIKLNHTKGVGNEILRRDDTIQIYIAPETVQEFQKSTGFDEDAKITFRVLFEDRNLLIVHKPVGLLSQKDSEDNNDTLIDQAVFYLWTKGAYDPNDESAFRPALCNRLDRNTSGIVIIGKSVAALQAMSEALQNDKIAKHYLALVQGMVKFKETARAYLTKDQSANQVLVANTALPGAKEIVTSYEPVHCGEKYSLLDITLKTGRSHQIRAHMAFLGHPLVGDKKYGHKGTNMTFLRKYKLNHQFLHAHQLIFSDLEGDFAYLNDKTITSPLSDSLAQIVADIFEK